VEEIPRPPGSAAEELILEITEQRSGGRSFGQRLVLEKQAVEEN